MIPASWRRVDPLGPLLGLAGFLVFVLYGFQGYLSRDSGLYAYSALQVAEGVPPYESVLNRAGPLAHLVPWLGVTPARLVGIEELTGMRVVVSLVSAGGVWALYVLGRNLHGHRLTGAVTASLLPASYGFVVLSASGPLDKPLMVVFLIGALLALVHRSWFAAGTLVALATLTWQPVFFVAGSVAVVQLAALRGRALGDALARFTVGGLVPTGLCVLGFWLAGALPVFINSFLVVPMRYTGFAPFARNAEWNARGLLNGFAPVSWVLLAGLAATLVAMVVAAAARLRHGPTTRSPSWVDRVALGTGCTAGLVLCSRAFDGWPDAFVLLPFGALGAGMIVHTVLDRLSARTGQLVGVAVCVTTLVLAGLGAASHRHDEVTVARAAVTAVMGALPRDATLMSANAPQTLVFSGKTNPTRHQIFVRRLKDHINDTYPGGMRGFVAGVQDDAPTVIATRPNLLRLGWLVPVLTADYVDIGDGPTSTFYVHRSLGSATVADARESLAEVMRATDY